MAFDIAGAIGAGYTPDEIVKHWQDRPGDMPDFDLKGASAAGYSPAEIIDHLNPKSGINVQGIPVLAPIQRGVGHLWAEGANLATDLGFPETGAAIRSRITQAPLAAETSGSKVASDLHGGRYLSALSNVPSAALEQLVPVAAGVGASILSGGSVPVTLAAGAGVGAVAQGDSIARSRAANNGRAEPTATDLALGLAGGAGVGAVGTIGLGGLGTGAKAAIGATVRHGLADAAQPELGALAGSLGTDQGAQHATTADMGASALTGLATRAGMGVPDVARGAVKAVQARTPEGRRAAAEGRWEGLTPEAQDQARQQAAAIDAVRQVQREAVSLDPVPDAVAANTAADVRALQVTRLAETMDRQGVLPETGKQAIREAVRAAQDPATALTSEHLDGVRALGLDAETTGRITDTLAQVNMLTSPDFTVAPKGPVEGVLRSSGPGVVGAVLGSLGGPTGTVMGAVAGHMLKPAGAGSLGALGKVIDRMVGTATPSIIAQAKAAAEMMKAAGIAIPDTDAGLHQATTQARSAIEAQSRLMGLQEAQDRATAQRFVQDYGDAQHMNRRFDAQRAAEGRATYADALAMDSQRTAAQRAERALEVGDALAMDRQRTTAQRQERGGEVADAKVIDTQRTRDQNAQRGAEVADALAIDRQQSQDQNTQRAVEVADAKVIDAQRTRGINLNEREGGKVATMALRRPEVPQAPQAIPSGPAAPKDASGPLSDPATIAKARAIAKRGAEVPEVAQPIPGMDGLSREAVLHGELLPEWQYAIGAALKQELQTAGVAKNVNTAREVAEAVAALRDRGAFAPEFAQALLGHSGRVVRGVFNLIRNEALLRHGIDMRTLEAQAATQ